MSGVREVGRIGVANDGGFVPAFLGGAIGRLRGHRVTAIFIVAGIVVVSALAAAHNVETVGIFSDMAERVQGVFVSTPTGQMFDALNNRVAEISSSLPKEAKGELLKLGLNTDRNITPANIPEASAILANWISAGGNLIEEVSRCKLASGETRKEFEILHKRYGECRELEDLKAKIETLQRTNIDLQKKLTIAEGDQHYCAVNQDHCWLF